MEVFQKYFSRLVVGNAPQIFPGLNRPVANTGNYQILVGEVRKISQDVEQAGRIAESIETANEDLFRDFDLSTFMEHFKMDALEKTILALAFKTSARGDLKTKGKMISSLKPTRIGLTISIADAILSTNFSTFIQILSHPVANVHDSLDAVFVATIVDRYIQEPFPNFDSRARERLDYATRLRYSQADQSPPSEVLAALYLIQILVENNSFPSYIRQVGSTFTTDEETCLKFLRNAKNLKIDEEQVAVGLLYTAISRTPKFSTSILCSTIRKEFKRLNWQQVVAYLDRDGLRVTSEQFLALYNALRPLAESGGDSSVDIQRLWGGIWKNSETQLSFISAFCSLKPAQLDATTIPEFTPSFTLEDYADADPAIQEIAARAVRQTLASVEAISAVFMVALEDTAHSETVEAKRLFQEVVVPDLDIFLVSAFGTPRPWSELAYDTVNSLFDRFLWKEQANYDFVLDSLWRKDSIWVTQRLIAAHANKPLSLPVILEHAIRHRWLDSLVQNLNGFGLDLASLAHAHNFLDLEHWRELHEANRHELPAKLLTFLDIKNSHELASQRNPGEPPMSVMLPVKTVSALLNILTLIEDKTVDPGISTRVQRMCITAYPRLVNYGVGFDNIIDENGAERNSLPLEANEKMEEHYKRMYSEEIRVMDVVEALKGYKLSRDHHDQDVFACMIHGLFDEYQLFHSYPLEALKTTALLFGGIIRYRLLPEFPLEIALGMILDAIKMNAHTPGLPMYKFGLEALKQTFDLFPEWPGFCKRLMEEIPGQNFRESDAWQRAVDVLRQQEAENLQNGGNGNPEGSNGDIIANGNFDEMLSAEPTPPAFSSINVDPLVYNSMYEDPSADTQEKVLFVLNNITERNLESKFGDLKDVMDKKYQQWFAGHLVEERAKMQPNYHKLYLELVKSFEDKDLWAEILRETYVSVIRMLNAESTMQSSSERTHLKNLGVWLGSLTLARDKPIKHRNIAFKQLLLEAFDTQRLIVVIPFVCKVLVQGVSSTIFRPPNPWLIDIIRLLIELYHDGGLKLNLKFEIEVLCKDFDLDHKTIEPSAEIQTRLPVMDEPSELMSMEAVDRFDSNSLNGAGPGIGNGRFSPEEISSSIPDLGPLLIYPPANDMVNQARLQEIVKHAITQAVREIIAPVVERSVTIAALSTAQMIHKDFATEPDENRVRSAAVSMVKRTAGSLALVTSKEPLRASMSNYIRQFSGELSQGLPEGTIMMCVNSNLEMACSQVEKKAEERAVPEIEEMIEGELENRRRHRITRPNEPYIDPQLSRWALTIPNPYKLLPGTPGGLNQEQMAIYDEFARLPRVAPLAISAHGPSSSDATRTMANEILQEHYPVPALPAPSDNMSLQNLNNLQQPYAQPPAPIANGRLAPQMDEQALYERIRDYLSDLVRSASSAPDHRYQELPRGHAVLEIVDALITFILRTAQHSSGQPWELPSSFAAEQICEILFSSTLDSELAYESLVHVLEMLCKFPDTTLRRVVTTIGKHSDETLLNVPLVVALMRADVPLLEWQRVDLATAKAIQAHRIPALDFFSSLVDKVLVNDRPLALYTDFARSLEAVHQWLREDPNLEIGRQLVQNLKSSGLTVDAEAEDRLGARNDQMEYIFDEWVRLCSHPHATDKSSTAFIHQFIGKQIVNDSESCYMFLRLCIDVSVDRFEHYNGLISDAYSYIDALAKLIVYLVKHRGDTGNAVKSNKAMFLESLLSLVVLILNHHHTVRGERFNQKVFFRLFSTMLCEFEGVSDEFTGKENHDIYGVIGDMFYELKPSNFPGFIFGWLPLISHRDFLPKALQPGESGWDRFLAIVEALMLFLGEHLKALHLFPITKDVYRASLKLLAVLHHDYPEFLAANHIRLCAAIPAHCIQLQNMVLSSGPSTFSKMPDPIQPGLRIDRIEEIRESPPIQEEIVRLPLEQAGLLGLIDQALQNGPSEDAVAHIAHAIQRRNGLKTTVGNVPVKVDTHLIDAIVIYVGQQSIDKAAQKGGPTFVQASPDAALLKMLVHELSPEAKYYFINSMVNQLRYPNAHTHYFSQALLEVFGYDMNDQEESDIRQQITRILLERHLGTWPQPWGLLVTIIELIKNEKYMFFDLPFIKAAPDVSFINTFSFISSNKYIRSASNSLLYCKGRPRRPITSYLFN